jgi:ech hydrogenase subunit E
MMAKRNVIPFGPQHPVLAEPIHFDLVTEDETVVDVIPVIGYVHRGLEKLVEKRDFIEYTYVAERICGICGYMHGFGYCQTVEEVMGIEVPERAVYLRTIWAELSRINSFSRQGARAGYCRSDRRRQDGVWLREDRRCEA